MQLPVLAKGFRTFFLLGGAFAAVIVPLWLFVLRGDLAIRGPLVGSAWHAHEMIYGFTAAILAGFLLTAVSNWTNRPTITGAPLLALAAVWALGRLLLLVAPGWLASPVDLLFLPALAAGIGSPIWASRNGRNAVFPVLLLLLWATNLAVHLDAANLWPGAALPAMRLAIYVIIVIILVVTGRVVPMFTRNTTRAEGVASLPSLDAAAIVGTGLVAASTTLASVGVTAAAVASPWVALAAAVAVSGRTARWGFRHTLREPLLWVLHLGHAWIAVGLALEAGAALGWFPRSLALHALTVGAIGTLTLGMMSRVALGHTGRPLHLRLGVEVAFGVLLFAAALRVFGPMVAPAHTTAWLWTAGLLWAAAFGTYTLVYAPILTAPRPDGRAG